jgi:hypothetical protein
MWINERDDSDSRRKIKSFDVRLGSSGSSLIHGIQLDQMRRIIFGKNMLSISVRRDKPERCRLQLWQQFEWVVE